MQSIRSAFLELREDDGQVHTLNELQRIQASLETLCECGDPAQRQHAAILLSDVNETILEIVK